jgi:hypothetical protein
MDTRLNKAKLRTILPATTSAESKIKKTNKRVPSRTTINDRTKVMDEFRPNAEVSLKSAAKSAGHSRKAFDVLQRNAADDSAMTSKANALRKLGHLQEVSLAELESLRFPIPPSLHITQSSNRNMPPRLDCVLAMGEPELSGADRVLFLAALNVIQWNEFPCEQTGVNDGEITYKFSIPPGIMLAGPNGLPAPHQEVMFELGIKNTEAKHIRLRQSGVILCDANLASATQVDYVMIESLGIEDYRKSRSIEGDKSILSLWCRWSQAQRNVGIFRPLLKDILMREGSVHEDPDIQDFPQFSRHTSRDADKKAVSRDMFLAFSNFRAPKVSGRALDNQDDLRLVDIYGQTLSSEQNAGESIDILRKVAMWLYENNTGLTLRDLCSPAKPLTDYSSFIDQMTRGEPIADKRKIEETINRLRLFVA